MVPSRYRELQLSPYLTLGHLDAPKGAKVHNIYWAYSRSSQHGSLQMLLVTTIPIIPAHAEVV